VPRATGLRALATVLSRHGEQTMLKVYGRAAGLRLGRAGPSDRRSSRLVVARCRAGDWCSA